MNNILKETLIKSIGFANDDMLVIHLTNERLLFVPLNQLPDIKQLSEKQREDFEIIDGPTFPLSKLMKCIL
ncbi:MAG: hypothetical protein J5I64_07065 [Saprospiraceae bacterium]|nr:hypothetical protein [Saprospiraceae bacterium]